MKTQPLSHYKITANYNNGLRLTTQHILPTADYPTYQEPFEFGLQVLEKLPYHAEDLVENYEVDTIRIEPDTHPYIHQDVSTTIWYPTGKTVLNSRQPNWEKAPPTAFWWARNQYGDAVWLENTDDKPHYSADGSWYSHGETIFDTSWLADVWQKTLRIRGRAKIEGWRTPDWSTLPRWANYWTIDATGRQTIWSHLPIPDEYRWVYKADAIVSLSQVLLIWNPRPTLQRKPETKEV